MRRTAMALATATALAGLLSAPAGATPQHALAAPAPGCEKKPEKAPTVADVPFAQRMFGAKRVWPMSTGSGVTVAVLDSGVDVSHPQLAGGNIQAGTDFVRGNGSGTGRYDCDGHGTAVTALIGARKTEGVGFQGLSYGATILPVVVSEQHNEAENISAPANPGKFARAIEWAVSRGADVINISLVLYQDHPAVRRAISKAVSGNVVVVASVGNGATAADPSKGIRADPGEPPYPAAYDGVIGVAAVDGLTRPLKTSPWGPYVDLVAPGESVQSANRGGGHVGVTGAGFATPFVSATAALVRSKWPEMSAAEVTRRLFATASPAAGTREKVGHGVVDPYRALTENLSNEDPAALHDASIPSPDPAAAARAEQQQLRATISLVAAGVGVVLAAVMLATLTLLPKGNRRRWRPGRARSFRQSRDDESDLPPAPVKLFEDLETS